jgi:hypothetical protein
MPAAFCRSCPAATAVVQYVEPCCHLCHPQSACICQKLAALSQHTTVHAVVVLQDRGTKECSKLSRRRDITGSDSARSTVTAMSSARRLMVAIDGSDQSSTALKWACRNLVGSSELHLVTVLPPMAYRCANSAAQRVQQCRMPINCETICRSVYPVAPVATAAAVAAVANQWEVGSAADVNFCVTRHLLSTTNFSLQTQKRHDEMHATNLLKDAAQVAIGEHVSAGPCTLQLPRSAPSKSAPMP